MSSYKTQQLRLLHRGRSFHFVSYEGQPADLKKQLAEQPPTWFLMLAGKRWKVGPQVGEAAPGELDRQFGEWLDAHVFSGAAAPLQSQQPPSPGAPTLAGPAEAQLSAIPAGARA
jgi:hypothetical protein